MKVTWKKWTCFFIAVSILGTTCHFVSRRYLSMESEYPHIDESKAAKYIGKTVLVGVTYYDHREKLLGREQWAGRIVRISNQEGIVIDLEDSDHKCRLLPDLSNLRPAEPGVYRLESTGKEVVDPDYLTTWICRSPSPEERAKRKEASERGNGKQGT